MALRAIYWWRALDTQESREWVMLTHAMQSGLAPLDLLRTCQQIYQHTHRESMGDMPKHVQVVMEAFEQAAAAISYRKVSS